MDEFLRLQKIVFGKDTRFMTLGFRQEGDFVGEHEYITRLPLPDHMSAKYQDIENLMSGVIGFYEKAGEQKEVATQTQLDPVLTAAALAFGFIYIHPFEDRNGRLHRYLIHYVYGNQNRIKQVLFTA